MVTYNIKDDSRDTFLDMITATKKREKITLLCVDKKKNISTGKIHTIGSVGTTKELKNTCKKGTKRIGMFHTHPLSEDSSMKNFSFGDVITGLNKQYKIICLGYKPGAVKCIARKSDTNLKERMKSNLEQYININGNPEDVLKRKGKQNSSKKDTKAAKKLIKKEFDYFKLM